MTGINMGTLNVIDILILAIFFISIIIGLGRGLVSEILSLVTLIAAFVIAILFTNSLAAYFTNTAVMQHAVSTTTAAAGADTTQPMSYMTLGISFAMLFAATIIVGGLIKMLLNAIFQIGILGFGNRILGGIFGAIRGVLFCLALIFLVQLSPLAKETWWTQSQLVPRFQPAVVKLGDIVSPQLASLKDTFNKKTDDLSSELKSSTEMAPAMPSGNTNVTTSTENKDKTMNKDKDKDNTKDNSKDKSSSG
jgi:membrane protein required for colicin V production